MTRYDDLTNNSTLGTNGRYLVRSKKKENALKASKQVWEGGLIIVVEYAGTNYVKITDGAHTFNSLASEGGSPSVTSEEISDASTVGKSLLTAVDAAAARTSIGAPSVADVTAKVAKAGDTMTGVLKILDTVLGKKAILAMSDPGVVHTANGVLGATSTYLQIGGGEWGANSYRLISFGYISPDTNHAPAFVGYQETSTSSNTRGDLIFGTRPNNNNEAPVVRLRIDSAGNTTAGGSVTATSFIGPLTGAASSAAVLTTGRTFTLTGGATGVSAAFNGSANASIAVTLATPTGAIRGGVLQAVAQADSTATDIAGLVADFNSLLAKLRTAGILAT